MVPVQSLSDVRIACVQIKDQVLGPFFQSWSLKCISRGFEGVYLPSEGVVVQNTHSESCHQRRRRKMNRHTR